jgi:hypothetical protein
MSSVSLRTLHEDHREIEDLLEGVLAALHGGEEWLAAFLAIAPHNIIAGEREIFPLPGA